MVFDWYRRPKPIPREAYRVLSAVPSGAGAWLGSYYFIFKRSYHFGRHRHYHSPLVQCLSFVGFVIFVAGPYCPLRVSEEIRRGRRTIMLLKSWEMSILYDFLFLNPVFNHPN